MADTSYDELQQEALSKDGADVAGEADNAHSEHEHVDIDEDVYGAAIFAVTFDFFEMQSGKDHDGLGIHLNVYRVIFVIFLLVCNYVLQLGMLGWVYSYVALPAVHEAQTVYRDYHAKIFVKHDDGTFTFSKERWAAWHGVDSLCGLAFANFWFMYAILCLWWILMLTEVRKTERLLRKFRQLPHTSVAEEMIERSDADENPNRIVKLTWQSRFTLYVLLLLPKILIALVLTVVGTVWLTASDSFSDLILNSVALEFIICIDEILFEGLLPESIKNNIRTTKMLMPKPKSSGNSAQDAKNKEAQITAGYHRSTGYCIVILGGVYLFMTYGQYLPVLGVFPGYADDAQCPIWWQRKTAEICEAGKECFPIKDNA